MLHGWQYLTPQDRETILRGVTDGAVYGGPYHLELDWVDACNARCFFCNSAHTHNGRSLPWQRAVALLEEAVAGGLRSIRLCGGGEPTLHPHFLDLIQFLGKHGIILDNLTTNGIALTDRIIDALQTVRVTEVRVSLNYPTASTYTAAMGLPATTFERVVRQTARLSEVRRGNPDFGRLMTQYFIYQPTCGLIRESYDLARQMGVDLVTYRELSGLDPALAITPAQAPAIVAQMREIIRRDWTTGIVESHLESHGMAEAIKEVFEQLSAELGGSPPLAPQTLNDAIRYCYIGWYSMTIMGSQAAFPCCYMIANKEVQPLGSLETASLGEVWRGPAYARLRREMHDYMLLQRQVPFFRERVRRIFTFCANHFECPITRSMCDEPFYEEADRRLEALRRRPLTRLWRLASRGGRFLERNLLGRKNW